MSLFENLRINLIEKRQECQELLEAIAAWKMKRPDVTEAPNQKHNLAVGDVVCFIAGYNNDIEYTSEIIGFTADDKVLVLWDCYWVPIDPNDKNRKFYKIDEVAS